MGSLILLLLIITRHVRPDVASHAAPAITEEPETLPEQPWPATPELPEMPQWAESDRQQLLAFFQAPAETPEISKSTPAPERPAPQTPVALQPEQIPFPARAFDPARDADPRHLARQQQSAAKLTQMRQQRQDLSQQLQASQQKLTSLQAALQTAQQQSSELTTETASLQQQLQSRQQKLQTQAKTLQQTQEQIQTRQQELTSLKENQEQAGDKLEVVVYDGPTGQKRTPIFIECRNGELIFHPEKVAVSTSELEEIPEAFSPLAYAVRALASYRAGKTGENTPPYVLMISRPDGIKEFYGCGQIMGYNKIAFGYELLEQDRELYFGKPDPAARQVILEALAEARKQVPLELSRHARMHAQAEAARGMQPGRTGTRVLPGPGGPGTPPGGLGNSSAGRNEFPPRMSPPGGNSTGVDSRAQLTPPPLPTPKPGSPGQRTGQTAGGTASSQNRGLSSGQTAARGTTEPSGRFDQSGGADAQWMNPASSSGGGAGNDSALSRNSGEAGSPGLSNAFGEAGSTASDSGAAGAMSPVVPLPMPENNTAAAPPAGASRGRGQSSGGSSLNLGSGPQHGAIKLEQTVVVKVFAEGIQVGKQPFQQWSRTGNLEENEWAFLSQLQKEIQNWPAPPEGIEWSPVLKLQIAPGGTTQGTRLESLADDLQVRIITQPLLERAPIGGPRYFE